MRSVSSGVLDMDMKMGIFNNEIVPPFTVKMSKEKAKMELCGYIKQNGLEKCIKECKPFGDLYRVCVKVTNELKKSKQKNIYSSVLVGKDFEFCGTTMLFIKQWVSMSNQFMRSNL